MEFRKYYTECNVIYLTIQSDLNTINIFLEKILNKSVEYADIDITFFKELIPTISYEHPIEETDLTKFLLTKSSANNMFFLIKNAIDGGLRVFNITHNNIDITNLEQSLYLLRTISNDIKQNILYRLSTEDDVEEKLNKYFKTNYEKLLSGNSTI